MSDLASFHCIHSFLLFFNALIFVPFVQYEIFNFQQFKMNKWRLYSLGGEVVILSEQHSLDHFQQLFHKLSAKLLFTAYFSWKSDNLSLPICGKERWFLFNR